MEEIIIDGVCINNCQYGKIIPYDYPTNGIDIECYIDYRNEIAKDCKENHNCLYKQLKRLEQENEKIKKQYNCYACGNCKGTEDYINLEKHHKGLRKQFDILVKRNNELSLRIEQLEQENEELKARLTPLEDSYFNGLSSVEIAGLAKKSIRITTYNRQLETTLEEIRELLPEQIDITELICIYKILYNKVNEAIGE